MAETSNRNTVIPVLQATTYQVLTQMMLYASQAAMSLLDRTPIEPSVARQERERNAASASDVFKLGSKNALLPLGLDSLPLAIALSEICLLCFASLVVLCRGQLVRMSRTYQGGHAFRRLDVSSSRCRSK